MSSLRAERRVGDAAESASLVTGNLVALASAIVMLAEIDEAELAGCDFAFTNGRRHPYDVVLRVRTDQLPMFGPMVSREEERAFTERMMLFWTERANRVGVGK